MAEPETIDVERTHTLIGPGPPWMHSTRSRGRQRSRTMQKSELLRRTLTTELTTVMPRTLESMKKKLERSPRALERMKRAGKITAWVCDMQGHTGTCAENIGKPLARMRTHNEQVCISTTINFLAKIAKHGESSKCTDLPGPCTDRKT